MSGPLSTWRGSPWGPWLPRSVCKTATCFFLQGSEAAVGLNSGVSDGTGQVRPQGLAGSTPQGLARAGGSGLRSSGKSGGQGHRSARALGRVLPLPSWEGAGETPTGEFLPGKVRAWEKRVRTQAPGKAC